MPRGIPNVTPTAFVKGKYPEKLFGGGKSTQYQANYIRGRILSDFKKLARPDAKVVAKYRRFLQDTYTKILKEQIPADKRRRSFGSTVSDYVTSKGTVIKGGARKQNKKVDNSIGYASGQLKESIKALVKVATNINTYKSDASTGKGRYDIEFYIKPSYDFHGEYVASGRKAGWIPIPKLIQWLNTRKNLKIYVPNEKESALKKLDRPKMIKNIAYAIAKTAKNNSKPPVIKDWYNMNKDKVMFNRFFDLVKQKGGYYRTLIRKNIVYKINKEYGSK